MSKVLRSVSLCLALAMSAPSWATASFANKELGLGVSGFALLPPGLDKVSSGFPLSLEGGLYIENGFVAYFRALGMLLQQSIGFGPNGASPGLVLGGGGQLGLRYLFLEEMVRPYVMLHLAGLYFGRDPGIGPTFYAGLGAGGGVDFFVADSVSLGVRATVDLFLTLNAPVLFSLGGGIYATTYF